MEESKFGEPTPGMNYCRVGNSEALEMSVGEVLDSNPMTSRITRAGNVEVIEYFKAGDSGKMICPDCGAEMVKTYWECADGSGWMGGWGCECQPTEGQKNGTE